MAAGFKFVDLQETRTNQLLNELYHDRARLERALKEACATMQLVRSALRDALDSGEKYDREAMENHAGALAAFVELHAS